MGLSSLASLASLQTVSEEEWHEEVVTLSPEQLVEATFKRLFPDSFLYALPVWKHKVQTHPHHTTLSPSLQTSCVDASTDATLNAICCKLLEMLAPLSCDLLLASNRYGGVMAALLGVLGL